MQSKSPNHMRFLRILLGLIFFYLILAAILRITNVCTEYVNFMPGFLSQEEKNERTLQAIFCPFSKRAY